MEQRTIKFRAWNPDTGMLSGIELRAAHGVRLMSQNDLQQHNVSDDKYVFMQFTGLLDKNGKEIYEGDIVECNLPNSDWTLEEGKRFAVRWSDTLLGFTDGKHGFLYEYSDWEIIGNIYQHPELLPTS